MTKRKNNSVNRQIDGKKKNAGEQKWIPFNPKLNYDERASFLTVLNFFLYKCPAEKTAHGAKTFRDYNIREAHQYKKLKNQLLNTENVKIKYIRPSTEEMLSTLVANGQSGGFEFSEIIIIVRQGFDIDNSFRAIRNAFAHGSFAVRKKKNSDDYYYFLEDRNPHSDKIKARIVLKASTMIRWKNIFEKL